MRRLRWPVVALVLFVLAVPAASAGALMFGEVTCPGVAGCVSLWVVGDDGTGLRKLPATDALWATWSHDGSRLAYQYGRYLRSIGADGSDDRLILDPGNADVGNPDWSPTGISSRSPTWTGPGLV
jgi:hypothetical protein